MHKKEGDFEYLDIQTDMPGATWALAKLYGCITTINDTTFFVAKNTVYVINHIF